MVAVLRGVRGEVTVHVVGWGGIGWGGARGGTRHTQQKPISIISKHKFIRPSAISMLRDVSLSQNGQLILAQPNFHTLYKSGQCSPKYKLISDCLMSYDRWDLQPWSIHLTISRKCFSFYLADFPKVSTFLRHSVYRENCDNGNKTSHSHFTLYRVAQKECNNFDC